jgi:WD40 repeat protein
MLLFRPIPLPTPPQKDIDNAFNFIAQDKPNKDTVTPDAGEQKEPDRKKSEKKTRDHDIFADAAASSSRSASDINDILFYQCQPCNYNEEINRHYRAHCEGTSAGYLRMFHEFLITHQGETTNSSQLLWIRGAAGTGKSVLAALFAKNYAEQVLASHFCMSDSAPSRDPVRIVMTLVYQLSNRLPEYRKLVEKRLSNWGHELARSLGVIAVFDQLIMQPIKEMKTQPAKKVALIVDSLDESEYENGNNVLLSSLRSFMPLFPPWLSLVVTSRPDAALQRELMMYRPTIIEVGPKTPGHEGDVRLYIESRLSKIFELGFAEMLQKGDIIRANGEKVLQKAAGSMLYVSKTLDKNTMTGDEVDALPKDLDALWQEMFTRVYRTLTEGSAASSAAAGAGQQAVDPSALPVLQRILSMMCCSEEPLTLMMMIDAMSQHGFKPDQVKNALRCLAPALSLVGSEGNLKVSFLHRAISDFVTDPRRKTDARLAKIFVDRAEAVKEMAATCYKALLDPTQSPREGDRHSSKPLRVKLLMRHVAEKRNTWLRYAARHGPMHAVEARDFGLLEGLLCNLEYLEMCGHDQLVFEVAKDYACALQMIVASLSEQQRAASPEGQPMSPRTLKVAAAALEGRLRAYQRFHRFSHAYWYRSPLLVYQYAYAYPVSSLIYADAAALRPKWAQADEGLFWVESVHSDAGTAGHGSSHPLSSLDDACSNILSSHEAEVTCVAFSPDNLRIASGGCDGEGRVLISDSESGELKMQLDTKAQPTSLQYSPDGRFLAAGLQNKGILVWTAEDGHLAYNMRQHLNTVLCLSFHPDSTHLVSGSEDMTAVVWDMSVGKASAVLTGHVGPVCGVAFSPKSTARVAMVATCSADRKIALWDPFADPNSPNDEEGRPLNPTNPTGQQQLWESPAGAAELSTLAFSSDAAQLVVASRDNNITCWGVAARTPLWTVRCSQALLSLAFNPNGGQFAAGCSGGLMRTFSSADGRLQNEFAGHSKEVWCVGYSPNGSRLVSAGFDKRICVWNNLVPDFYSPEPKSAPPTLETGVNCVVYTRSGASMITASRNACVQVWDRQTGSCTGQLSGHLQSVNSVDVGPKDEWIVSGGDDFTARVFDLTSLGSLSVYSGHQAEVKVVRAAPQGSLVASCDLLDGRIHLWDALTAKVAFLMKGHEANVVALDWSGDSALLVSAGRDHHVRVWDPSDGCCLESIKCHGIPSAVAFQPGSKLVAVSTESGALFLLDAETGTKLAKFPSFHSTIVSGLCFSPSGRELVSSSDDYLAYIWDVPSRTALLELRGHTSYVPSARWSTDGAEVVTASWDGTTRCYGVAARLASVTRAPPQEIVNGVVQKSRSKKDDSDDEEDPLDKVINDLAPLRVTHCSLPFAPPMGTSAVSNAVMVGGFDGAVRAWDLRSGHQLPDRQYSAHQGEVTSLCVMKSDSRRVATGGTDRVIHIWSDGGAKPLVMTGHTHTVTSVVSHPFEPAILTSTSFDKTVRVWNLDLGKVILTLTGHEDCVLGADYSPDGKRLVSCSKDGTARVWEYGIFGQSLVADCKHVLRGHKGAVNAVAHSNKEAKAITAGEDGAVMLWDVATGANLASWTDGHAGAAIRCLHWTQDGAWLFSGGDDKKVVLRDASNGVIRATFDGVGPQEAEGQGKAGAAAKPIFVSSLSMLDDKLVTCLSNSTVIMWELQALLEHLGKYAKGKAPPVHPVYGPGGALHPEFQYWFPQVGFEYIHLLVRC